ncbi:MAG: NUDIX hydrolase [Deltaproteobacteria bacterium]|nr:NUDIX hydrolase [Deltaproteobacteria bacterium]
MKKEVLASGKYLSLVKRDGYEMVERINCTGVVVIIPVTDDGQIIFVEQFRPPIQMKSIELPAGLVSDTESAQGESMVDAAMRELEEETGFRAARFEEIGVWPTTSGMS